MPHFTRPYLPAASDKAGVKGKAFKGSGIFAEDGHELPQLRSGYDFVQMDTDGAINNAYNPTKNDEQIDAGEQH